MDGIIVASDQTLEWILPWWLEKYQKHNSFPLAFIDLGLSFEMKDWCREHGEYIPLRVPDFADEIADGLQEIWRKEAGSQFELSRNAWFKKPLACLKSPFERTLWIDIDCEVRGNLSPIFAFADGFAMAKEQSCQNMYNSGVIAFRKEHPILFEWASWCQEKNHLFRGDQEAFSEMLREKQIEIEDLPSIFNWSRMNPDNPKALIQHWHGNHGKFVIRALRSNI